MGAAIAVEVEAEDLAAESVAAKASFLNIVRKISRMISN